MHNATLIVRDEDPSVFVNLQTVRLAVLLRYEGPFFVRRYPENPAERNIDNIQVPVLIKGRAFQERVRVHAKLIGGDPRRADIFLPELRRYFRPNLSCDVFRWWIKAHR